MWQDYVLAVGAFLFSVALIPTLRSKDEKPVLWTSISTALVLAIFAATFVTLDLWLSAAAEIIGAVCWGVLALQVFRKKRK